MVRHGRSNPFQTGPWESFWWKIVIFSTVRRRGRAAARLLADALNGLFPRSAHPPYRLNGFHLERWDLRQRQYLPFIGED